jgi:hypothetical protein
VKYLNPILLAGATLLLTVGSSALHAQDRPSRLRHEFGLWIGASSPVPGTQVADVLSANVGGGGFYRINWPWVLYTEFGFSWSQYFSRTTQKLTTVPVYGALAYRLPIDFKVETFVKLGGGGAWLEVRPANSSGWDPLFYTGLEFSLAASRRLRVGLRLDYNLIYEKHLDPPRDELYLLGTTDPRYLEAEIYKVDNGHFFHFGLFVSYAF